MEKKPPKGMGSLSNQVQECWPEASAADPDVGLKKEKTKDKTQYDSWC